MSNSVKLRTFIGVPLEKKLVDTILRLQERSRKELGDREIKWERAQNLHITLQFLGDTSPKRVEAISGVIGKVIENHRPFEMELGASTAFGGNTPRVLVVEMTRGIELIARLQSDLSQALSKLGFKPEAREYTPHITFGRVRRGRKVERTKLDLCLNHHEGVTAGSGFEVGEVIYFKSELSPMGANYTPISKHSVQ